MLQKGFLQHRETIHISTQRILRALLLGIGVSFCVYILFCGFRELFRMMDTGFTNGALIFDEATRNKQNLGYAFIAVAFGNSVFLGTLFIRPIKSIRNTRRLAILNDQIFFGGNFLFVFFKLFVLFGAFATGAFDLYHIEEHRYILALLALVLFLESWKHITRTFRRSAFKWLLLNVLVVGLFSWTLSQTSIFNYRKIDKALMSKSPKVDVPISVYETGYFSRMWQYLKIYQEGDQIVYRLNKETIPFENLMSKIIENRSWTREELWANMQIYVLASRELPISEIKKVERELALLRIYKMVYVTQKPEGQFTSRWNAKGIFYQIDPRIVKQEDYLDIGIPPPPPVPDILIQEFFQDKTEIVIQQDDSIVIQGKTYADSNELLQYFKDRTKKNAFFNLIYEPDVSYQNYISVLGVYQQALYELRDEIATSKADDYLYGCSRQEYEEEQRTIKKVYPYLLLQNFDSGYIQPD